MIESSLQLIWGMTSQKKKKNKQIVRSLWRNSTENEGFGSEGKVDLRNVEKIWKTYHDE